MNERTSQEGGCLCGAVRYRVSGAPLRVSNCHCGTCRKASGAPFVIWGVFEAKNFTITKGEPARFASSSRAMRQFCGRCGSALAAHYVADEIIGVTVGTLDRPGHLPPTRHIWTSSRLAWVTLADDLPRYAHDSPEVTSPSP